MAVETENMVSVFILAYNQEGFIEQTINSILEQKTNFSFNIVIGEDCSTDNTLRIIKSYQKTFPEKIRLITSNENVGLIKNFVRTIKECDGKYIAICDGDDFWIDKNKLKIQVDFLEENPDFSIVFTNKNNLFKNGKKVQSVFKKPDITSFENLVQENYIPSVTVLFRNSFYQQDLPSWFLKYPYGDWPVYLMTVKDGTKIKYLDMVTANYRKDTGITSNVSQRVSQYLRVNINILKDLLKEKSFGSRVKTIKRSIEVNELRLLSTLNHEKKYLKAIHQYIRLLFRTNLISLTKIYLYSLKKSFKK